MLTFGVVNHQILAPIMPSTVVREMLLLQVTISTLFAQQESDLSTNSTSNTEELKLELNFPKETGSGPPFGCSQPILNTEPGPHQVKSISWNPEEMMPHMLQVESINLLQLFIGDLTGLKINMFLLILNTLTLLV